MTAPSTVNRATATPDDNGSTPWLVLVVDDEPAVHELTRLLLARLEFEGSTLDLRHAATAAEARSFLSDHPQTALVILDVVMETDDAGLTLCRYIRETLGNREVQIVLRTGQPGQAPERSVVRDYDINGYYLKTELTAQKLQSMVICALRAWNNANCLRRTPAGPWTSARPGRSQPAEFASLLGTAIDGDLLELSMSPVASLSDGRVCGVELHTAWPTRCGDLVGGPALVALAEGEKQALKLGRWLLRRACDLASSHAVLGGPGFRVSVNLPPELLGSNDLVTTVADELQRVALKPSRLALEFTEPGIMRDPHANAAIVKRLRGLGVAVIVDEFGSGAASLAQVRLLEPEGLKIAASFVRQVDTDPQAAAIVRSAIALAHTQGLGTWAEGVGNQAQWEFLRWEECELAQGPFVGGPMNPNDLRGLLAEDCWRSQRSGPQPLH